MSGDILSGVARKDMTMKVRLNSSLVFDLFLVPSELVKKIDGSEAGLCPACRDADELSLLKSFNGEGGTIEIGDPVANEKRTNPER